MLAEGYANVEVYPMVRRKRNEPSSSTRRIACAVAAGVMSLVAAPARAADVEPVALRYEGSGACPSETEFVARVRAITRRWALVADGSPAVRTIRVLVTEGPRETGGKLTIAAPDGATSEREISGPSCSEVSEALAVMVAVAIDPRAGAPRDADERPAEDAGPSAAPVERPRVQARRPRPSRPAQPPRQPPAGGPRLSVDLRAETTSAVIRGGLYGVGASARLDLRGPEARRGVQIAAPSLAIGLRQSLPKERALRGGSVDVSWTAANVRLCPIRVVIDIVAEVSPCAETNIGVLRASARGFAEARDLSTVWLDVGGSIWGTVSLSDRVFFSSTLFVTMPLSRQPFVLASGARVATVPPLGVFGGVGLGFRM